MKYEKHRRDYTILGITAVIEAMTDETVEQPYKGTLTELISVVLDGVYYHYQLPGDWEQFSRCVLARVNENAIDFEQAYATFDYSVAAYEQLITQPEIKFSLQTIIDFFHFYKTLFPIAYLGMGPIDFIDLLAEDKREDFKKWAIKIRRRGEVIYKKGEMEFIPRYLAWFSKVYAPAYTPNLLQYLVHREMIDYIEKQISLPSPEELAERKRLLYVRQFPLGQMEYLSGAAAEKIIGEKHLLGQPLDQVDTLTELKGQVAFVGTVRGKACLVRSRIEMDKFQPGDIIISQMTDPSYLPIMKQAAAFVTNEGGLLCHAAIVARELKKPCVIGTKHATHVFRDGDIVEVDAMKGVVRKIQ